MYGLGPLPSQPPPPQPSSNSLFPHLRPTGHLYYYSLSGHSPSEFQSLEAPPGEAMPLRSQYFDPSWPTPTPASLDHLPQCSSSHPSPLWSVKPILEPSSGGGLPSASTITNTSAPKSGTPHNNLFFKSTGVITGIAFGGLGFILLVVFGCFIFRHYRRRRNSHHFPDTSLPSVKPLPPRQRFMSLFEDDDDAYSGSPTETTMHGIPGIVAALDLRDSLKTDPSIQRDSFPSSFEKNTGGHPPPITISTPRRGSNVEPPDSASSYSDPPPTPASPPGSKYCQPPNGHPGCPSGELDSSSIGHLSHCTSDRTQIQTPPPTLVLGGSFRPRSSPPSPRSAATERERPMSLFGRLRGGRKSTSDMLSSEPPPAVLPSVPNIIVSSASIRTLGHEVRDVASQYPFPSTGNPICSSTPPYSGDVDTLSIGGSRTPIGLLRQVPRPAGSRTSLGDHVDYTRPMLAVVFNRLESTTSSSSGSVMTARSGATGRGDHGHS